jgi:hypothetical protein
MIIGRCHSFYFKPWLAEIEQQAKPNSGCFEGSETLAVVRFVQSFRGLSFDQNRYVQLLGQSPDYQQRCAPADHSA